MTNRLMWMIAVLSSSAAVFGQLPPVPGEGVRTETQEPQFFVAQREVDLGEVFEGDVRPAMWVLENRGNADLVIERTRSSCGCTVVKLADEEKVIPPGGSLELKAEFNSSGRSGLQKKTVKVYSNDPSEPDLSLTLAANVVQLYGISPATLLNLRAVPRGEAASKTLDILPGPGRQSLTINAVEIPDDLQLSQAIEDFKTHEAEGKRIRFTVLETAPLGLLAGHVKLRLSVDGVERERTVPVRADVVGALTWSPTILDATRQTLLPGRRLAPVTIRSTEKRPFEILGASIGAPLEVVFRSASGAARGSDFTVHLTVQEGATPGPFATTLEVRTSSLDQPWIGVPVFGIIDPPITIDPRQVLLRDDGTPAGKRRRVKLMTGPSVELEVMDVSCDSPAVRAQLDDSPGARKQHLCYVIVELVGELPMGMHEAILRVTTGVKGHEVLEIPVTIDSPERK